MVKYILKKHENKSVLNIFYVFQTSYSPYFVKAKICIIKEKKNIFIVGKPLNPFTVLFQDAVTSIVLIL